VPGVDSARAEFRPDPASIRRARSGQLWWVAWAAALSALTATLGVSVADSDWMVLLSFVAAVIGLGFVAVGVQRHRRLGQVLSDGHALTVYPHALTLPGEPPLDWSQVVAVVAHRLEWAGLEVTLRGGRRVRVLGTYYGATVDELVAAFGRHVPVGDPEAAYGNWSEYWNG
jgi:hypothetical protein